MAAGTVDYQETRGDKDFLGMIANQIKDRVSDASDMARSERQFADNKAEEGGTSLEEAGVSRGHFFARALGSKFGGDAIAKTRGRFAKSPSAGIDPAGTTASRFRGGFDYNVTNRIINDSNEGTSALASSVVSGFSGVQRSNIEIAKALIKVDDTLAGIERSQMNMARAIMFLGYTMTMMRTEQQRASGRDSLRREERSIERGDFGGFGRGRGGIGGQGFGGAGGGRTMRNVTDSRSLLESGASFGTSQLLGQNSKTVKGALKVGKKIAPATTNRIAKMLPQNANKIKITGDSAEFATKTLGGAGRQIAKKNVGQSLSNLGANNAATRKIAESIGKNSSKIVKKPIAMLNPVKIKGLLTGTPTPFGLLPAAGETGIKGMAKMLDDIKMDFLLDELIDVPELTIFDNDLARMTPDEMMDFSEGMASRTKTGSKKMQNAMEVAMTHNVKNADEAVDLYAKLLRGDESIGGIEYTAKEADTFMKSYLGPDRYAEFTKGTKQPFKTAAKSTKTTKMLKATTNAAETAIKGGAKGAGKITAKSAAKSVFKQLPVIAGIAGIYFGLERAAQGDLLGAGLEVTSGLLGVTGTTPGIGLAIDSFLLGRDLGMMNKGGLVPGGGPNRDSIPTMLTSGEFILNRDAVDKLGINTLTAMNSGAFTNDFGTESYVKFGEGILTANKRNYGEFSRQNAAWLDQLDKSDKSSLFTINFGGDGDMDKGLLKKIRNNTRDIANEINSMSTDVSTIAAMMPTIVNNTTNNYAGDAQGSSSDGSGGDFSDSGLDAYRLHYLGSLS